MHAVRTYFMIRSWELVSLADTDSVLLVTVCMCKVTLSVLQYIIVTTYDWGHCCVYVYDHNPEVR